MCFLITSQITLRPEKVWSLPVIAMIGSRIRSRPGTTFSTAIE